VITREEALRRADEWVNRDQSPEQRASVGFHEFEEGYIVWRESGPEPGGTAPGDRTRPPATVGGGRGVIDKETGEFSTWPSLPVSTIAEQYKLRRKR
jgi:hypothetical protein